MFKKTLIQFLLKIFFRVSLSGLENYPKNKEKILYIINPSSLLDPILLSAFMPKKIAYIVDKSIAKKWYLRPLSVLGSVIEVDFSSSVSTKNIIQALEKHEHCMVFHDRQFGTNPHMMQIYEATAFITTKTKAKLLPVLIENARYSYFSYFYHKTKLHLFPKISLKILPMQEIEQNPSLSNKENRKLLASKLHSMMSELLYRSNDIDKSIFHKLKESIKVYGKNKVIAEDQERNPITYKTFFLKFQALGAALHTYFPQEERVGFLLPNSLAGAVTYFSLLSHKHVPAMLNFSAGIHSILAACQTVQLKYIVSSKKFIKLGELEELQEALLKEGLKIIYLEDVAKNISTKTKISALIKTLFLSIPRIDPSSPCAILFTSGSEGLPKAVLMSHRNVNANHAQVLSIVHITSSDKFFNCLPMFHTFGLTVGTLLPVLNGMQVFLYPSPLHYRIVPQLFYETLSTFICGTDTFLSGYARYGKPFDFFNARYVIAGAEKLRDSTIATYTNKFDIIPLEGYGATETSPVLSVNTPANNRAHSVGKLLPGIEYKLLEVEGIKQGGNLCVRGDNIMLGYMYHNQPNVLVPPHEGWHELGDIVDVDKENFVYIKGRAKRFAKIGGEMVSFAAVEQALAPLLPDSAFGIVSIPHEKKGEFLVLIVENSDITNGKIATHFAKSGYPTLWAPKSILHVNEAPVLGSGKFDYTKAKQMALEQVKV